MAAGGVGPVEDRGNVSDSTGPSRNLEVSVCCSEAEATGNLTARGGDDDPSSPSARVIALIHHTMLLPCVVLATVGRQSRKVASCVDLYRGRRADIDKVTEP